MVYLVMLEYEIDPYQYADVNFWCPVMQHHAKYLHVPIGSVEDGRKVRPDV